MSKIKTMTIVSILKFPFPCDFLLTKVDNVLSLPPTGFGTTMSIKKFSSRVQSRPNPYDYGEKTYDDPVEVIGRAIIKPSEEVVSKYGGSKGTVDCLFVWSRLELIRKFPSGEENWWITDSDTVVYNGVTPVGGGEA